MQRRGKGVAREDVEGRAEDEGGVCSQPSINCSSCGLTSASLGPCGRCEGARQRRLRWSADSASSFSACATASSTCGDGLFSRPCSSLM
ncbi:hypothetical protein ACRAWF_26220 [Streptomyces sp. L7]